MSIDMRENTKELIKAKLMAEEAILKYIDIFEQTTDCIVYSVDMSRASIIGDKPELLDVMLDVRIDYRRG